MEVFFNSASLTDVRNAVRELGSRETQNVHTLHPSQTLAKPLLDMATDILRFLSSSNRWDLTEFEGTLIAATITEPGKVETDFIFTPQDPLSEDFSQAFSFAYMRRGMAEVNGQTARIHPRRIGSVYPLEQALKTLSSPFYLLTTEARVSPTLNKTLDVAVKTTMVDLADYNCLQINSLRRVARGLEKRFPQ